MTTAARPISVLIVDDSAMVRKVLSLGFEADPGFRVAGVAANVEVAQRLLDQTQPDVITLDIEMPYVDGLTWLRQIMAWQPVPVVVISSRGAASSDSTIEALEIGAVDVIAKPMVGAAAGLGPMMEQIRERVRAAAHARLQKPRLPRRAAPAPARPAWPQRAGQKIIALGSSTGGVQALTRILPMFPADSPAILVVQHMPEGFTGPFARRLDSLCPMEVREARDGDLIQDGQILIAPGGGRHMQVRRSGFLFRVALVEGPPVNFSRPSVDVLMHALAEAAGPRSAGAILTGMGRDGAQGLLALRRAGGRTFAQDAETSVVHGMPAAAIERGGAMAILPLDALPARLLRDDPILAETGMPPASKPSLLAHDQNRRV
jgi:two-component system chemotaxis response regulator CheB